MTDTERTLEDLEPLARGSHDPGSTACIMEAVAYVAGEPWTDTPECASPVIAAWLRAWNDVLTSDDDRERLLRPLVGELIGTAADESTEDRRSDMAMTWLVTECAPTWLRLAGLDEHAKAMSAWRVGDGAAVPSAAREAAWEEAARPAARAAAGEAVWEAAGEAARAAAGEAAWEAAWDAARAAAGEASWDAARDAAEAAARDAAESAARSAARSAASGAAESAARGAAWAAARDAAGDYLAPTVASLQASALACIRRMIAA